ncbi:MAG: hypothetical protein ACRDXE_06130, partial [Acidimicrobiales bacterium]
PDRAEEQAVDEPVDEPPDGTGPPGEGARRRRWPTPIAAAVGLVIVVLVVAVIYSGLRIHHDDQVSAARSSALATATADGRLIGTFHYQHLDADLAAVEARSTPAFAKQYKTARSALTKVLEQYKANSDGTVVGAGVQSASTSHAVVLVFVNQGVTNSAIGSKPRNEASRLRLTLDRVHGKWLLSNVQVV